MPVGLLVFIVRVALALYLDRGTSDRDQMTDGDLKADRLTR